MPAEDEDNSILSPVRTAIELLADGPAALHATVPGIIRAAIDYVIDPIRTARTSVAELDNVEKTFVGLKVEHFIRDYLDVPKGVRDLVIAGVDVDVKNTTGLNWMIPRETYSLNGVCLLIRIDDAVDLCWLGLVVARDSYLGRPNRDQKRSLNRLGRSRVLWLLESVTYPGSPWRGLDIVRFRELRKIEGGTTRAAIFFEENLNRRIDRAVIESLLFDQKDYMKRLRGNGGARDLLHEKGIRLDVDGAGNCIATRFSKPMLGTV